MIQADTGKWYAYVSSGADVPDTFTLALGANDAPDESSRTQGTYAVVNVPLDDDSDIDVVYGDETVTLHYEEDLDDLATVSVDRTGVPEGGEVHVTVSDFRLNLNPLVEDAWVMYADGSVATYTETIPDVGSEVNWVDVFGGDGGEFTVTDEDDAVEITNNEVTELVILRETGSNTGVFESQNDDVSNIKATGDENDDFTIAYADDDVQVFIEEFDSTLELIADGTWDSGETATVRLTNENLNLNTLIDDNFMIDDDLPVMRFGTPITLKDFTVEPSILDDSASVDDVTNLTTLSATSQTTTFTVTLTDDDVRFLNSTSASSYVHYYGGPGLTTSGIDLLNTDDTSLDEIGEGLTIIPPLATDADGEFTLEFDTSGFVTTDAETENTQLRDARTAAQGMVETAEEALGQTGTDFDDSAVDSALTAIKTAATTAIDISALTGDGSVDEAIGEIQINATMTTATDDRDRGDFRTAAAVIGEVEDLIDEAIAARTGTTIFALDIFTFGADANDAIYRALLEETDSGSGVFEATIEYQVLNQRTVDNEKAHTSADPIGNELAIILNTERTGGDAPEFTYSEDNTSKDAPTNTGEVSVDAATYRVADDVTITLVDADLNTDSGAREIYRIADDDGTIAPMLVGIEIGGSECASELKDVSLRETANDSGVFEGSFTVPNECDGDLTTGESITVTYVDFRDETGEDSEWSDSATIGAVTGSISLDRTVYPVPGDDSVTIHVSVDDADENISSSSRNTISGVTMTIANNDVTLPAELEETEPDSGIFEANVKIGSHIDGTQIEQGDIITVMYEDASDASGNLNTASDSATFDLRNAVLQSDKSVYVIGQDALLTLIEPDLNLNSRAIDSIDLDRIVWDSDAYDDEDLGIKHGDFGAVPQSLRENGENTGIFHVVITVPETIDGEPLERGEEITLSYTDYGPSGADYVGDDDRDVELFIATSDFGATIELDQNVYTWTDKVFVTIVASDYNFDSNIVDEIGTEDNGEITIRTRADELEQYRLAETGPDTGVFTGEIVLTGQTGEIDDGPSGITEGSGPTNGRLEAKERRRTQHHL